MDKIRMDILGLSTSPSSGGAYALILNEVEGNRRLPIIIGTFEAQAIALELEHIKPPRPMTHDLLKNVIQSFESKLKQIYINDLSEGTFYAQIIYDRDGDQFEQDARPSDAIALAIRFDSPIFVAESVLDEAGIASESGEDDVDSDIYQEPSDEAAEEAQGDMSKIDELKQDLEKAIEKEEYEKAAKLRDQIKKLKG